MVRFDSTDILGGAMESDRPRGGTVRKTRTTYSAHRCKACGGRLPMDRYVYSRFTGNRFHYDGECRKYRRSRTTTEGGE